MTVARRILPLLFACALAAPATAGAATPPTGGTAAPTGDETIIATPHVLHAYAHAVPAQAGRQRHEPRGIEPDVDERAERHVAGDAAERVEDGDGHAANIAAGPRWEAGDAPTSHLRPQLR